MKYSGSNLSNKKGISQRTCALLCFRTSACTHWTYNKKFQGGKCWLKSSNEGRSRSTKGSNSGQKACGAMGFSLSTLTSEAKEAMDECRDPWTQLSTGCYLFHPRKFTWYEAKQTCTKSGGYLVEIGSREESGALFEAFDNWDNSDNSDIVDGVWLGLNDVFHDYTWVWDHSGTPLGPYPLWERYEPNNFQGAQHCGASYLNRSPSKTLHGYRGSAWNSTNQPYRDDAWYDFSCEEGHFTLGAICEAPGVVEHIRDDWISFFQRCK